MTPTTIIIIGKVVLCYREMLATHILTHTFQHTLFDWLNITWDPPIYIGPA